MNLNNIAWYPPHVSTLTPRVNRNCHAANPYTTVSVSKGKGAWLWECNNKAWPSFCRGCLERSRDQGVSVPVQAS